MQKHGVELIMNTRNQQGFTLIEVMIAIVVLAIGILGVVTMQTSTTGYNATAHAMTGAATVAADRMEMLRALPYDDPMLQDGGGGGVGIAGLNFPLPLPPNAPVVDTVARPPDGSATTADQNYDVYWNIVDDYPTANTKTVRVIAISTGLGPQKIITLESVIPQII